MRAVQKVQVFSALVPGLGDHCPSQGLQSLWRGAAPKGLSYSAQKELTLGQPAESRCDMCNT